MPHSRFLIGTLPFYSVLIVTGMLLAILLSIREEKRQGLPKDTIVDLALIMIPISVICARIYYVVFNWAPFADNPLSAFYIWEGGLAIYGGLIGGAAVVLIFERRRGLPLFTIFDIVVPGVALAQSIGRWGNFFNMEAYGLPVTDPRLQFFPFAVLIPEGGETVWHLATFFYESVWNFLVFLVLMFMRRRTEKRGDLFFLYSLLYGAGRLVIEELRMDSLMAGTLRISQVLAFCIVLVCLMRFLVRLRPWNMLLACIPSALQVVLFSFLPGSTLSFFFLLLCFEITLCAASSVKGAPLAFCLLPPAWLLYAFYGRTGIFALGVTFSLFALLTLVLIGVLNQRRLRACPQPLQKT